MRNKCSLLLWALIIITALFSLPAAALKATIDPSEIAVGARPMGLGRAFTAVADDASSIFQNPAGITTRKEWQLTSMAANLLSEVQYNQLGLTLPLGPEAFGLGFVGAAISGSIITTRDPVTKRVVPSGEGAIGYNSSVLFFSGATSRLKNISLGGSLKIFYQGLTGVPGGDVTALGQDLDVGLKYTRNPWLSFGAYGSNLLPYSAGGKLIWSTGITESIPATVKLGTAIKVLGPEALRQFRIHELTFSYDWEFYPAQTNRPTLNHLGMEWLPWETVVFRLGLDQDAVATGGGAIGTVNNLAAGVGVKFYGLSLDYAYHTFHDVAGNSTHFFSISYSPPVIKPIVLAPTPEAYLKSVSPPDYSVIFSGSAAIGGAVGNRPDLGSIWVNQRLANFYPLTLTFEAAAVLPSLGLNTIEVQARSQTGRIQETRQFNLIRLPTFSDIPPDQPDRELIGYFGALGYVKGSGDGRFNPKGQLTQQQLLDLFAKIKPAAAPPKGTKKFLTRAEAVSMIARFSGSILPNVYERPFSDVPTTYWAAKPITLAKNASWLDFIKGDRFYPTKKITRLETVRLLAKTRPAREKILEVQGSLKAR